MSKKSEAKPQAKSGKKSKAQAKPATVEPTVDVEEEPPLPKLSAKQVARHERIAEALDYRKQGYTYEQIAEAMECVVSTAYKYVKEGLASIVRDSAEEVRSMMLERLQIMQQKLMAQVVEDLAGPEVMAMIIKIDEKIARMHGISVDGGADDARSVGQAAGEGFIEALRASAPILRPDGAVPARPVL